MSYYLRFSLDRTFFQGLFPQLRLSLVLFWPRKLCGNDELLSQWIQWTHICWILRLCSVYICSLKLLLLISAYLYQFFPSYVFLRNQLRLWILLFFQGPSLDSWNEMHNNWKCWLFAYNAQESSFCRLWTLMDPNLWIIAWFWSTLCLSLNNLCDVLDCLHWSL